MAEGIDARLSGAFEAVCAADHPSPDEGGPCATCAFRPGTEANRSDYTVLLAKFCVEGVVPFNCHEHPRLCRGWNAAVNLNALEGAPQDEESIRWRAANAMGAELLARCIYEAKRLDDGAAHDG